MKKDQTEEEFSKILDLTSRKKNHVQNIGNDTMEIISEKYFEENKKNIFLGDNHLQTKWAKFGKFLLYILIFLLPLFFLPLTSAPVAVNKQILLAVLVILSFVCYAADIISTKQIIFPKSRLVPAVFGILAASALSAMFSDDKTLGVYGNLIFSDSLVNFVLYFLIFWLAAVFFRKEDFKKIGAAFFSGFSLIVVLFLSSVIGLKFFPFDFAKQAGFNTVGLIFDLGIFISFGLTIAIIGFLELKLSLISRAILIFVSILSFIAFVILNLQILWIALAAAMIVFVAYKFIYSPKSRGGEVGGSLTVPMAAIILFLFFALVGPSFPLLMDNSIQIKPGLSLTLSVAKEVLKNGQAILGSGPATFVRDYALYRPLETNQGDFWLLGFGQGYSFMATALATLGILGVLTFLFLFYSFFKNIIKNLENKELIVAAFGIMILIIGLFFAQVSLVQFVFIFLGFGLILAFSGSVERISVADISNTKAFLSFIGVIIGITAGLAMLYLIGQKYAAAVYFQRGIDSYVQTQDAGKTLVDIYKAVSLDADSGQYLRAFSQYLLLDAEVQSVKAKNLSQSSAEAVNINSQIQNDLAQAVAAAQKATAVNSQDSANWANLANVYERLISTVDGADQAAAENYRKASALDQKNPELPLSLARVLLNSVAGDKQKDPKNSAAYQNKIIEAKNALDKAIALKPDYAAAYWQKALVYIQEEKIKEAAEELEQTKLLAPSDYGVAFQLGLVYYNDGQLSRAQAELERAVLLNSEYSNARYILGLVYAKRGKKEKAIEQMEKVLKFNLDNEEVKKILDDLKNNKFNADTAASSLPEKSPVLPIE